MYQHLSDEHSVLRYLWKFQQHSPSNKWVIAPHCSYPEIGDGNFEDALWTFKQWQALKMWVHYGISIILLWTSSYNLIVRQFQDTTQVSFELNGNFHFSQLWDGETSDTSVYTILQMLKSQYFR